MNYEDFDIFLITKDNGREQKEVFYGYKTLEDNGIWLKVAGEKINGVNSLTVRGSYLQPYISIYRDQNYGAISNSFYRLVEHLKSKNIKLTRNQFFDNGDFNKDNVFTFCIHCPETDTLYNEIKYNNNFSFLRIDETNGLIMEMLPIDAFSIPIAGSEQLLLDGHKKGKTYISDLIANNKVVAAELSGGYDSRIIFSLGKDLKDIKIITNGRKAGEHEYYDGLISKLLLEKYYPYKDVNLSLAAAKCDFGNPVTIQPESLYNKNEKFGDRKINKVDSEKLDFLFSYGSFPVNSDYDLSGENISAINKEESCYRLTGMSLEVHKLNLANCIYELMTTTRRSILNKYINNYYRFNRITICPFQDKDFLKIAGMPDFSFPLILFGLFNVQDSELPVWSGSKMYRVTDEQVENALKLLKES